MPEGLRGDGDLHKRVLSIFVNGVGQERNHTRPFRRPWSPGTRFLREGVEKHIAGLTTHIISKNALRGVERGDQPLPLPGKKSRFLHSAGE